MNTIRSTTLAAAFALAATMPLSAQAAEAATWSQKIITPEIALKAALAAKEACQKQNWQVTVAVTDPSGLPLVLLRDRYAGWHTVDAAIGKARTAASWRESTTSIAERAKKPGSGDEAIVHLPGVVVIGGGMPIEAGGQRVGAIGVSGAPNGGNNDTCAKAGIAAIEGELAF
ncbi:MAG: heme-binding protein [Proteobacteria bacterium]|nr:heme-binding protein [Pseudomonadota bacterium]